MAAPLNSGRVAPSRSIVRAESGNSSVTGQASQATQSRQFTRTEHSRVRVAISNAKAPLFWFFLALAIRFLATVALHLYSQNTGYEGFFPVASGADDRVYWYFATEIYRGRSVVDVPNIYPYVLAAFYFLTGPSLVLGKLLNVLAGAGTVYVGVLLVNELARDQTQSEEAIGGEQNSKRIFSRHQPAHWAGLFLTFYPSLLFFSSQLEKDAILVFLGLTGLYLQIRFLRTPKPIFIGLWLIVVWALYLFRFYASIALAISLLLYLFRFRRVWLVPALVLAALVPQLLGLGWFGWTRIEPILNAEHLSTFRETNYSTGGSAVGIQVNYGDPLAFVTSYGSSFATAMFGPFPWQISSGIQLVALPETLGMWFLFPIWVRGIWRLFKGKLGRDAILLIFSLVLMGMVALFSDNIGANTRLRLLPWDAFLLYAALKIPRIQL